MWLIIALITIASINLLLYVYKRTSFRYWSEKNVATLRSNYFFGDIANTLSGRENLAETIIRAYKHFKGKQLKYGGLYFIRRPIFLPIDPQLVRNILVRDFDSFVNRGIAHDLERDPLGAHLFNLNDEEWKMMRQKITSTFTSGKLRGMMPILYTHTENLTRKINNDIDQKTTNLELNEYFERIGIDIIGHVAFGLQCNTLNTDNSRFYKMTRRIFKPKFLNIFKHLLFGDFTNPGNLISLTTSDHEMCEFFLALIRDTVANRKQNAATVHKDFLQLLIEMHEKNDLSIEQIAAQTFIFFIAAFETSSKALNFTMYELSKNLALQQALREDLQRNVKSFSYDEIMQNKRLDMVVKETLRKYPSVVFLHRQCTKAYKLSDDVVLDKDTILLIPIYAFHNDAEYFASPEVYNPQRFDETDGKIDPLTYFPFGDGPRNCIGMRFGMLQVKLILAKLITSFEFHPSSATQEPLIFNPISDNLLLTFKNPIYFNCRRV